MSKNGRRFAGIVCALLLSTLFVPTVAAAADAPENLVRNSGFEHNLAHWETSVGTAVYSIDRSAKVAGCCSVKGVETDPGSLGRLYQDVTDDARPGNLYQISGWIKTSNVIGSVVIGLDYVGANPFLGVTPFDGHVMEIGNVSGTHDWAFYQSPEFFLPAMPSDAVALWFLFDFNAGAGTAWWDNVSLARVETEVPNTLTVVASPPTLPANGTSTSAVTVTLTNAGLPVAGEPVTFAASGTPLPACGTLTQASATTNAIGQATSFYISSLTVGFCTVTVTDFSGTKGSVTLTQTAPPNVLIVVANPMTIPADGLSTSTITVRVVNGGLPVSGDQVTFAASGNTPPACGTLNPPAAVTNAIGQATSTYSSSRTLGLCSITATDSSGGKDSATVVQTFVPNTLTVVANPPIIPANGTSSSAITVTVTNAGLAVANLPVTFAPSGTPLSACGTLSPITSITNAIGQATSIYISSLTAGFCRVTVTDVARGIGSVTLTQTAPPNTLVVVATPPIVPANGTSSSTITVTVTNAGVPVVNDPVALTVSGTPPSACGTVTPAALITNALGQATSVYVSSLTAGFCSITATDVSGGHGNVMLTQTASLPNTLAVVANPPSIPADGVTTSTIMVTVTTAGVPVAGDPVTFTLSGTPLPACGALIPPAAITNATGQATSIYMSSHTAGLCTITVTDSSGGKGSVTLTQTALPNTLVVVATPPIVPANGTSSSTITVTVTNAGVPVVNDPVSLTVIGTPPSACGTVTPAALITNALGQATSLYVSSLTAGSCSITATDVSGGHSNVMLTQTASLPRTLAVVANPPSIPADGVTTSTIMVTVTTAGVPVAGDPVTFTVSGAPPSACGTLLPPAAVTNAAGQAVSIYTSSLTVGLCTIKVTDASGATGSVTLTQHL